MTIPDPPETVKAVQNYLHLGWSLFPTCAPDPQGGCKHHERCKSPGKRSLVKWRKYQRKPPTAHQVRAWFEKWPNANVAVFTGSVSGIAVLDVDTNDADLGPMELTPRSLTGRGQHNFFELKRHLRSQRISDSLEMKADGNYVVLPNSIHPSGSEYVWAVSPWELDGQLAPIPDWLEKQLCEKPQRKRLAAEVVHGVCHGIRHLSATQFCGKLLGALPVGDWEGFVWPLTVDWNARNRPPLPLSELREVFEDIAEKELAKRIRSAKTSLKSDRDRTLFERIKNLIAAHPELPRREIYRRLNGQRYANFSNLVELALHVNGNTPLTHINRMHHFGNQEHADLNRGKCDFEMMTPQQGSGR